MLNFDEILRKSVEEGASDIHLKVGLAPIIRKGGQLTPLASVEDTCEMDNMKEIFFAVTTAHQRALFEKYRELDLSYGVPGLGRFRLSLFQQRGTLSMVIRHLSHRIPPFEELKLPPTIKKIAELERGLVLVTGVTGSGKSTTLASMIEHINQTQAKHILTIEDPIEFVMKDRKSIITQRELGSDTHSFASALRAGLRQDPDVIMMGELRDQDSILTALVAAETGHLVLCTLHTGDCTETVSRLVSHFPADQQMQVRHQLASCLKAVVCQRLAMGSEEGQRLPAVEILLNTPRVKEMIIDPSRTKHILDAIEEGHDHYGTQSFDQALLELLTTKQISFAEALRLSTSPENFALRAKGIASSESKHWESFDHSSTLKENTSTSAATKIELALELEKVETPKKDEISKKFRKAS